MSVYVTSDSALDHAWRCDLIARTWNGWAVPAWRDAQDAATALRAVMCGPAGKWDDHRITVTATADTVTMTDTGEVTEWERTPQGWIELDGIVWLPLDAVDDPTTLTYWHGAEGVSVPS